MRRVEDGAHLPRSYLCEPVTAEAGLPAGLDDRTLAYVVASRPVFDQIRQASSQLAGLLVLAAAGGRSAQDHPMFALALAAHDEARDGLGALRPPDGAMHHHRHLLQAAYAMSAALDAAGQSLHRHDDASLDAISVPLRRALQELHWATAALPGFTLVDLAGACCAPHAAARRPRQPEQ